MNWEELIHNTDFRFCDDGIINKAAIVEFLTSRVFGSEMQEILTHRYELMSQHYNDDEYDVARWQQDGLTIGDKPNWYPDAGVLDISADKFNEENSVKQFLLNRFNCGHDMPVWMRLGDCPRPRVMVIAQDPLRDARKLRKVISLSTPWAFHSHQYRQGACTKVRDFISRMIVNADCEVYLTDYAKVYFSNQRDVKNDPKFVERVQVYNDVMGQGKTLPEVLKAEMDVVAPQLIITLGNWGGNLNVFLNRKSIRFSEVEFLLSGNIHNFNGRPVCALYHPNAHDRYTKKDLSDKDLWPVRENYEQEAIARIREILHR